MEKKLIQLEKALRSVKKLSLSAKTKESMRRNLLMHMETPISSDIKYTSLERVSVYIKKLAKITEPSNIFKAKIKENILSTISKHRFGYNFFMGFGRNWQKVFSVFMIAVLSFSSMVVYFVDIPITMAAKKTSFQNLYGDVEVARDGQTINAFKTMQLEEGDVIITGAGGVAVIRYFDDSISRLYPLTELKIQRLYQDKDVMSKTKVEVELTHGHVWSQVVNLVGDQSSFEIMANDVKTKTSHKASFDMNYVKSRKKLSVSVFENKVEVSVPQKKERNKEIVVEGYVLNVDKNKSKQDKIKLKTEDKLWVNVNKNEDKQYKNKVDEEKTAESKKKAGVLPGDPLYPAKKLNESTKLLVTMDDKDKNKLKVDIAVKRLTEAITLLSDKDKDSAQAVLDEFSQVVDDLATEVKDNDELMAYAKSSFQDEEKDLSIVLPDDDKYVAKEALRDAELKLAITPEDKKRTSLKLATEKVIESKELFQDDKSNSGNQTLLNATTEIVNVSVDDSGIEDPKIIEQKEDTLSTIEVLKEVVNDGTDENPTVKKVIGITEDTLKESMDNTESDQAIVLTINDESRAPLKEVQE